RAAGRLRLLPERETADVRPRPPPAAGRPARRGRDRPSRRAERLSLLEPGDRPGPQRPVPDETYPRWRCTVSRSLITRRSAVRGARPAPRSAVGGAGGAGPPAVVGAPLAGATGDRPRPASAAGVRVRPQRQAHGRLGPPTGGRGVRSAFDFAPATGSPRAGQR